MLVKGQFANYHDIYCIVYKSQIVFEERNYVTFSGMLPDWMFTWCTLCTTPPRERFNFLPLGRAKKIWGKNIMFVSVKYGSKFKHQLLFDVQFPLNCMHELIC